MVSVVETAVSPHEAWLDPGLRPISPARFEAQVVSSRASRSRGDVFFQSFGVLCSISALIVGTPQQIRDCRFLAGAGCWSVMQWDLLIVVEWFLGQGLQIVLYDRIDAIVFMVRFSSSSNLVWTVSNSFWCLLMVSVCLLIASSSSWNLSWFVPIVTVIIEWVVWVSLLWMAAGVYPVLSRAKFLVVSDFCVSFCVRSMGCGCFFRVFMCG